jgi:hypothetical protein
MVHVSWHANTRSVFILKEGVLHWGTPVGIVVTVLFIVANLGSRTFTSGWWRATALVALCFIEWTVGTGVIIGGFLWSRREQATKHGPRHTP